jgi:hypothetical protein
MRARIRQRYIGAIPIYAIKVIIPEPIPKRIIVELGAALRKFGEVRYTRAVWSAPETGEK